MENETMGGAPIGTAGRTTGPPATTDVARDQAAQVGRSTAEAGQRVAGTAAEQAGQVVEETRRQAADLLQEARRQAAEQARGGQQQAVKGLRSLAAELHQMADRGGEHGPASDLAEQAAGRVEAVAGWLDQREPGDLVGEVRRLARRRPGAFLAGAALAGVLAGRLTRGAVDAQRTSQDGTQTAPVRPVPPRPAGAPGGYPAPPPPVYQHPGGTALPPQGPLDAPGVPPPYTPGSVPPGSVPPGAGYAPPPPAPGTGTAFPAPAPAPQDPGAPVADPYPGPDSGQQPTTVGEYVEDLRRSQAGDPRTTP